MKKCSGKNVDVILEQIKKRENVSLEDIGYQVIGQSGFSIFSKTEIEYYTTNDIIQSIKDYITDVLTVMNLEPTVEVTKSNQDYRVNINTNNNSLIIGVNGKTLYALEVLTRQVISNIYKKRINVHVDANDYFKNKEERLVRFARKIAAEVGKTKIDAKLDPMPNYDRKVIHSALKDVHYVYTKSYGEKRDRYLIVHYDRENDLKYNQNKQKNS